MQPLHKPPAFVGPRQYVNGPRGQINYRRGSDSDHRRDEWTRDVCDGNGSDMCSPLEETGLPQRGRGPTFGIESVDTVAFGGCEDDVVLALARNLYVRHVKRLCVNIAVNRQRE